MHLFAKNGQLFMVTMLITNFAVHSTRSKHTDIYFFFWHFQSFLLLLANTNLLLTHFFNRVSYNRF